MLRPATGERLAVTTPIDANGSEDPPLGPFGPHSARGDGVSERLRLVRLRPGDVRPQVQISPNDEMFGNSLDHYFTIGRSALNLIQRALQVAGSPEPRRILDLPCGHGRVMRYLRAAFPEAEISACDLNRDGVEFCAETFGALPVFSAEDPRDVPVEGEFDLIWCGSLLTHLDADRWPMFIELFRSHLSQSGVMCFTVNGAHTADLLRIATYSRDPADPGDEISMPSAEERIRMATAREYFPLTQASKEQMLHSYATGGFGYTDYGDVGSYGLSVSSPAWLCGVLERFRDLRVVVYGEHSWDQQDFVACARRERMLPPVQTS